MVFQMKKKKIKKKSDIIIYIDKTGRKRWKWRNKKGAIYERKRLKKLS